MTRHAAESRYFFTNAIRFFAIVLALTCCSVTFAADTPSGTEIAQRRFDVNRGWGNLSARLVLELQQNHTTARRELDISSLEEEKTGERNSLRVLNPGDLRGTVLLTHTHDNSADEQWLYLPALKRTRRIALESKGGAFLSSQLNFEDLTPFQPQRYSYRRLPDTSCGDTQCYVVESIPSTQSSVYSRLVNQIRQDDYRLVRTEFFDREGRLSKTITVDTYTRYREKFWKPLRMTATDHLAGATTIATWSDLRFDADMTSRDFDVSALRRIGF